VNVLEPNGSRRCVFMDRDGIINENAKPGEYIRSWPEFRLIPAVVDWIRILNALDLLVIVVTNQRGVALGHMTEQDLDDIHFKMRNTLVEMGAQIDDVFTCTHAAEACDCRKPKPGMVLQAAQKWNISISDSLMIGDSPADRELARRCGLRFVLASNGRVLPDLIRACSYHA